MARGASKPAFLDQLRTQIRQHRKTVTEVFGPLQFQELVRKPASDEWNILQCFEHLVLTHDYYAPRIEEAMLRPVPDPSGLVGYRPSFWGRIYMAFALNPRWSFPTADAITPDDSPDLAVLDRYMAKQKRLLFLIEEGRALDLRQTRVRIEKGVGFNLGDCIKILVYHDGLHIGQAERVLGEIRKIFA